MSGIPPPRDAAHRITSLAELRGLHRRLKLPIPLAGPRGYAFFLPELTDEANAQLGVRMTDLRRECGCFAGGLFMGMSTLLLAAGVLLRGGFGPGPAWRLVLSYAGVVLGSGLVGKLVGLAWARLRMIRLAGRTLRAAGQQTSIRTRRTGGEHGTRMPRGARVG